MKDYSEKKEQFREIVSAALSFSNSIASASDAPYDYDSIEYEGFAEDHEFFMGKLKQKLQQYPGGDAVAKLFDNPALSFKGVSRVLSHLVKGLFNADDTEVTPTSHLSEAALTGNDFSPNLKFLYKPLLLHASTENTLSLLNGLTELLPFHVEICHVTAQELVDDSILDKVPTITKFIRATFLDDEQKNILRKSKSEGETVWDASFDCGILYVSDVDKMHCVDGGSCAGEIQLLCENAVIKERVLPTKWLVVLSTNAIKENRIEALTNVINYACAKGVLYGVIMEL